MIITTLVNLVKVVNSFGMHPHHSRPPTVSDCMPFQWNDSLRRANVILHPGMMHTLMNFLGCVGTLMKASGVDVLISAAFAGITSIVNGKAWTNGLRAYLLIIAMLLQNFYSNGAKTYEELNVYLETARGHPTGRLRVTALSSLHCCRSCSCAESGTVTSSSSSTVSRQCCHASSQQVITIMPAT